MLFAYQRKRKDAAYNFGSQVMVPTQIGTNPVSGMSAAKNVILRTGTDAKDLSGSSLIMASQ